MPKLIYQIIEHDGGWAYRVDGVYSETYLSHDAARSAALIASREQRLSGDDAAISFQDTRGTWHEELIKGDERPDTGVEG